MTFWIDAQLDPDLAARLGSRFKVVAKHLVEVGLEKADDDELCAAARRFGRIVVVTKDSDFVDIVRRLGPPPQVMHLRCGNMGTPAMQLWLSYTFAAALERVERGEPVVEVQGP